MPEHNALEFFNDLSGTLIYDDDVSMDVQVFFEDPLEGDGFRDLTEDEWAIVVLPTPTIRMRGMYEDEVVEHAAPDGVAFTVRDLIAAVVETERQTRDKTDWFGGVDTHHVFFEGIELRDDGVWAIAWGS